MAKPTVTSVQAQVDTHEAVCAERWKETILRIKRIEHIMIGTAGTTILLLIGIIVSQ
jgi:cell division protein FtsL